MLLPATILRIGKKVAVVSTELRNEQDELIAVGIRNIFGWISKWSVKMASFVERDTGFEPVTTCLESRRSTPELIPQM